MKRVLAETMMNVTFRDCLSIELHRTVAVVTKTGIVHHEAHVQQRFCCTERLLPPQNTEGQTAHHYTTRLRSLFYSLFTSLYYVLSFSCFVFFSPLTLSHCSPGEMRGGVTMNHSLGYEKKKEEKKVSVCASAHMCVSWATV